MKNSTTLATSVTMSYARSNWMIRVEDTNSGTLICELEMSDAAFDRAVAHLSNQPATATVSPRAADLWGKLRQHRTEDIPGITYDTWDQRERIAAAHDFDGEQGRTPRFDSRFNGHQVNGDGTYLVHFYRHVDPEDA